MAVTQPDAAVVAGWVGASRRAQGLTEKVVDPTGCGDTFAGGLMGSIAAAKDAKDMGSFESIRRALVHGTVVASFTIEAFSLDRLRSLTRGEIDARYNEYASMVRV